MTGLASFEHLRSRLYLSLGLNALVITAEFLGGCLLDSIGLMSDAGHNLVDQGSLFLALYAHILTRQPASETRTFGYHRAGVVAGSRSGAAVSPDPSGACAARLILRSKISKRL